MQWEEDDFDPTSDGELGLSEPEAGRTYTMYHGTTSQNARAILASGFRRSSDGMLGPGVYLSRDLAKASRYPINHPNDDKVVIKVRVNVGRVIAIRRQRHPLQKTWHDHGYDSAWVPPNCGMVKSGLEEDCIWDPRRIVVVRVIRPRRQNILQPQPPEEPQGLLRSPWLMMALGTIVGLAMIIVARI